MAVLAVGLLKPWGSGANSAAAGPLPPSRAQPSALGIVAPEAPSPRPSPGPQATSGPCYYGLAERLFTSDTTNNGVVHTWYGLAPVAASGPGDASIPVVVIHSRTLGQLGYCLVTDTVPAAHVLATLAWQLPADGPARSLDLERALTVTPVDPDVGAVYGPPASITGFDPGIWPAATYVFEIRLDSSPAEWFAVRVS